MANKREAMKVLRFCDKSHGGPHNAASVYGHRGSSRTCIRLFGTDTWIYDPGWEQSPEVRAT